MTTRTVKIKLYGEEIAKVEKLLEYKNQQSQEKGGETWNFDELASVILKIAIDDRVARLDQ
jgi:hypothetical protein